MEVQFTPEVEKKLHELATESGRGADEVLQDALAGYFEEVAQTRATLNSRYDDLKSGRVKPIDGEQFFESLRRREEELLKKHSPPSRQGRFESGLTFPNRQLPPFTS